MKNILVTAFLCSFFSTAAFAAPSQIEHFVGTAPDLGRIDPSTTLRVRLWLNLRDADGLTRLANAVIDETSPDYRQWLTNEEFKSRFLPRAEDVATVRDFLKAQGLRPGETAVDNRWVKAEGTVATIEKAFGVELHDFQVEGKRVYASIKDPVLPLPVSKLVAMIGGLTNRSVKPLYFAPRDPKTGMPVKPVALTGGVNLGNYTIDCFNAQETHAFASADGKTTATYSGMRYSSDPDPADAGSLSSCGYDPATIQKAYGLDRLFARGLDGTGETVVVVEGYGSPTAQVDLDTYSQLYHLPPTKLQIDTPEGTPVTGAWNGDEQGWAGETTMDIESVHLMAPGANIAIVAAIDDSDDGLAGGLSYVVENHLGDSVSNSWSDYESQEPASSIALFESILKSAVVQGISIQFGSGDYGDYVGQIGYADVSYPASSAYATAVGGTSLAVNPDGSMRFQTGWGNNQMQLSTGPSVPLDPPTETGALFTSTGYQCGSGGGVSRAFAKPRYQRHLSGTQRQVPDIAFLADAYTGMRVLQSAFDSAGNPEPGTQSIGIVAGTSLSCPMFSAFWAIANQGNGESLGLASALMYRLPKSAITDILPVDQTLAVENIQGSITDSSGTNPESTLALGFPETSSSFLSTFLFAPVFYSASAPNGYVLTFGTDSSLAVTPGWDPVTGLGTPNGEAFVDAAAGM